MKIYTQNLHNYIEDDRYGKLEKVADYIYKEDIDFVCLQEVGQYKYEDEIDDVLKESNLALVIKKILKKKYNVDYYLSCSIFKIMFNSYEEGLAILSKIKPESVEDFFVSESRGFDNINTRKVQKAVFTCDTEKIEIFNAHIGSTNGFVNTLEHFNRILEKTSKVNRYFIAGDLNIGQGSVEYDKIMKMEIHDLVAECSPTVGEQYTYYYGYNETKSGNGRIDHILSSHSKVVCSTNIFKGHEVSDHAGIMVEY